MILHGTPKSSFEGKSDRKIERARLIARETSMKFE
jgi:hypothetical protein